MLQGTLQVLPADNRDSSQEPSARSTMWWTISGRLRPKNRQRLKGMNKRPVPKGQTPFSRCSNRLEILVRTYPGIQKQFPTECFFAGTAFNQFVQGPSKPSGKFTLLWLNPAQFSVCRFRRSVRWSTFKPQFNSEHRAKHRQRLPEYPESVQAAL